MPRKLAQVDVYGCVACRRERVETYLAESYESDDFFSEFTTSQEAGFYDHDSLEWGSSKDPKSLYELIKGHFRWASFASEANDAVGPNVQFNAVVLLFDDAVFRSPRSYEAEGLLVKYVGRYPTVDVEGSEPVDDDWRQCCGCMNIWESQPDERDSRCPDCNSKTRLQTVRA